MSVLIVLIVLGCFLYLVPGGIRSRLQHKTELRAFLGEYSGWDIYASAHDRGVVALNHERRLIVVGTVANYIERPWSDIAAVEVEKDGQSIIQTSRGAAVGAAVGVALLGPLGLLMLSTSKRKKERVNELALKILIDERTSPVHRIIFFRMKGNGAGAKDKLLQTPAQKLEHFQALISNAIRSDKRTYFKPVDNTKLPVENSEDRVAKLWELRQAGALTDQEFAAQKSAVLAGPSGNSFRRSLA